MVLKIYIQSLTVEVLYPLGFFELCAIIWQYIPGTHMKWKVLVHESGYYSLC